MGLIFKVIDVDSVSSNVGSTNMILVDGSEAILFSNLALLNAFSQER